MILGRMASDNLDYDRVAGLVGAWRIARRLGRMGRFLGVGGLLRDIPGSQDGACWTNGASVGGWVGVNWL